MKKRVKRHFLIRLEGEVYVTISNIYLDVLTSEGAKEGEKDSEKGLFFNHVKVCSGNWQTVWKDEHLNSHMRSLWLRFRERERSDLVNGVFTKVRTYVDYDYPYLGDFVSILRQS